MLCNHHHYSSPKVFPLPQLELSPLNTNRIPALPTLVTIPLSVCMNLTTLIRIIQFLPFCYWFISCTIMTSVFIHVVACVKFLSKAEKCFIMYSLHFVYPFICLDTWLFDLGCCENDSFKQRHKIHSLSYLTLTNPEFNLYQTLCCYKQCFLLYLTSFRKTFYGLNYFPTYLGYFVIN